MKREIKKDPKCTTFEGSLSGLSDEAVVLKVVAGDRELYRELIERYEGKLLRYAKVLLHDRDDAADVVQEAFVGAYRNLKGFDTERRFSSWMYRIVHNVAQNMILKRKFLSFLSPKEWLTKEETVSDGKGSLEAQFADSETKSIVKLYMDGLPAAYRDPLILFYLEERSYEEIGEILNMPIGTVGTRINRAKKMIRERIMDDDDAGLLTESMKLWKTLI